MSTLTRPRIAVSVGDINGVGIEIALKAHEEISKTVQPIYCINRALLLKAAKLLNMTIPDDFELEEVGGDIDIEPGVVSERSGEFSYHSFLKAVDLAKEKKVDAVVTLPIHKEAWSLAGIKYKGHTDMLRDIFDRDAIMMLGCSKLYVALFTEHIPLQAVASSVTLERLVTFLEDFHRAIGDQKVAVLGLNPHAGDNGVLGSEETIISEAIKTINVALGKELFIGPLVPDIAFTPHSRAQYTYFIAMYHDQGLAPLKALYFDESVNISLNLPIIRTSVDHGTAFDIAYQNHANTLSYINAINAAVGLLK
ncbi:4-hydroxythreonine-4-phosphate dehydrogenase [Sulfurimonas sp. HSL3-7]|uniref:4-hydroxythreonine-4-phosphate dehydrogenase n=1 Tax=Sulfonitrofixus jiaomeiensis TaxID=3131938 RepID=UPI0031F77ECD